MIGTKTTANTTLSEDFWLGVLSPVLVGAFLVAMAPLAILRAWVVVCLWDWYLVPAFGFEPLRIVYAFGVILLTVFIINHPALIYECDHAMRRGVR